MAQNDGRSSSSYGTNNRGNGRYSEQHEKELDMKIRNMALELKQVKNRIDSERAKVQEYQTTISKMKSDKFEHESNMIASLAESQNELRYEIQSAIQSKIDLCLETSQEINRLRKIIFIAQNGDNGNYSDNNDESNTSLDGYDGFGSNENKRDDDDNESDDYKLNLNFNSNMYENYKIWREFPNCDRTRIDKIILERGDGMTYPQSFKTVNLKYIGYTVEANTDATKKENWKQFTEEEAKDTIYETQLSINENIIGLEQAILSMTQNEKALVWIPYRLAWGYHGASGLIPGCTDVIFYLDLQSIGNEWILSWNLEKLIWMAHLKNENSNLSNRNKFPKALIIEILSFLNKNFDKKYYLEKQQQQQQQEQEINDENNIISGASNSDHDNDMYIVDDSDHMDESNIVIGHRNYDNNSDNNNNDINNDNNNNNINYEIENNENLNNLENEIHQMAYERRVSLDDIDDYNMVY